MKLYIGSKNYSSWCMQAWVLLTEAGIPFEEELVRSGFDPRNVDSAFKTDILQGLLFARVPVLVDADALMWDTPAIAEHLAERFPEKNLWPADPRKRALARSVCTEMHSGFSQLHTQWAVNMQMDLAPIGERLLAEDPGVRRDLDRIISIWSELLRQSDGPMLFGRFTIADAFCAPMVTRLVTYGAPVPALVKGYMDRVLALPSVSTWCRDPRAVRKLPSYEDPFRNARP